MKTVLFLAATIAVIAFIAMLPGPRDLSKDNKNTEAISGKIQLVLSRVPSGLYQKSKVTINACKVIIETPTNLARCEKPMQVLTRFLAIDLSNYSVAPRRRDHQPIVIETPSGNTSALGQEILIPFDPSTNSSRIRDVIGYLEERSGSMGVFLHCNDSLIAVKDKTYHRIYTRGTQADEFETLLREASKTFGC